MTLLNLRFKLDKIKTKTLLKQATYLNEEGEQKFLIECFSKLNFKTSKLLSLNANDIDSEKRENIIGADGVSVTGTCLQISCLS